MGEGAFAGFECLMVLEEGNWQQNALLGPEMVKTAYLDIILAVHGLGKAGSQWIFTLGGKQSSFCFGGWLGLSVLDSAVSVMGSQKVTCLAVFSGC